MKTLVRAALKAARPPFNNQAAPLQRRPLPANGLPPFRHRQALFLRCFAGIYRGIVCSASVSPCDSSRPAGPFTPRLPAAPLGGASSLLRGPTVNIVPGTRMRSSSTPIRIWTRLPSGVIFETLAQSPGSPSRSTVLTPSRKGWPSPPLLAKAASPPPVAFWPG